MVQVRHIVAQQLTHYGYTLMPSAIQTSALMSCLPQAQRDAKEVPVDPSGGLPWAYDVFPEDYSMLTSHAVRLMTGLGARSKVTRVTLIKKAPGEGRRYWHNDESPTMPKPDRKTSPKDVLVLYYLTPTFNGSGCLVVRPGFVPGPKHEEHNAQPMDDEIHVPVELGDVVLMDPRTQHASLENWTLTDRLLIRVWTENEW